jgi:hypothetical protein
MEKSMQQRSATSLVGAMPCIGQSKLVSKLREMHRIAPATKTSRYCRPEVSYELREARLRYLLAELPEFDRREKR